MTASYSESKKTDITPWQKNQAFLESMMRNGIDIEPLNSKNKDALMVMVNNNKEVDGFSQMNDIIFSGKKFESILSNEQKEPLSVCFVAREKFTGEIAGFVIYEFSSNDKVWTISELGVDQNFAHGKNSKVKNVGSSLLLVGCNELLQLPGCFEVGAITSTDEAKVFYQKFGFEDYPEGEASDDFEIHLLKENYPKLESDIIARSPLPKISEVQSSLSQSSSQVEPAKIENVDKKTPKI